MTREQRVSKVIDAVAILQSALVNARNFDDKNGVDHEQTLIAWEAVEKLGATVHRQARLLAGKSKGG